MRAAGYRPSQIACCMYPYFVDAELINRRMAANRGLVPDVPHYLSYKEYAN